MFLHLYLSILLGPVAEVDYLRLWKCEFSVSLHIPKLLTKELVHIFTAFSNIIDSIFQRQFYHSM